MRSLSDLIVLVKSGDEIGSAIAHRLFRCHFRVCVTEVASPLAVSRGSCFSEAVYDITKTVENVTGERTTPSIEQIYRTWRNGKIPVVVDPESMAKALIKPDVLVNAMMLKRKTNATLDDAPLVIGIGPGFSAGEDVHFVIESERNNLGRVIQEGTSVDNADSAFEKEGPDKDKYIWADDSGVFTSVKNIGDTLTSGEVIGYLGDNALTAPMGGILRGLLRNETKVLANTKLAEIDSHCSKTDCQMIRTEARAIAGGVLESIMFSFNIEVVS
jgi:xanthine dehydrogenase accessory factor